MELKKSKQASLETNRPTFLLLGLIFAFGITLESFEWLKSDIKIKPISAYEGEELYEPINEVMIVKPQPKSSSSSKQQRASKGPVIVTPEPIAPVTPSPQPDPKPNPNPSVNPGFNIDNPLPGDDGPDDGLFSDIDEQFPYAKVEQKPEFIGGQVAMMKFLAQNVKYPEVCRVNGIQGRVYVSFIIDEKGNVTDVELKKGKNKHLDKEAIRVIKSMPQWTSGKQRGKAVKVKYVIPVSYKLRN